MTSKVIRQNNWKYITIKNKLLNTIAIVWQKEKLLIMSNFSFFHSVFKRWLLYVLQHVFANWKGLIAHTLTSFRTVMSGLSMKAREVSHISASIPVTTLVVSSLVIRFREAPVPASGRVSKKNLLEKTMDSTVDHGDDAVYIYMIMSVHCSYIVTCL